jgi:large subunit ribosomal protein L13
MKTYTAKPATVEKKWLLIDAEGVALGRLASQIALRLRGKHKPTFTPHVDTGDYVVVINAEKVRLTGKKDKFDIFYWHTGYPGGIKGKSKGEILKGKYPGRVITNAVKRMMPKDGSLARHQMTCLRVYAGNTHPHEAQKLETVNIAALNPKNKR